MRKLRLRGRRQTSQHPLSEQRGALVLLFLSSRLLGLTGAAADRQTGPTEPGCRRCRVLITGAGCDECAGAPRPPGSRWAGWRRRLMGHVRQSARASHADTCSVTRNACRMWTASSLAKGGPCPHPAAPPDRAGQPDWRKPGTCPHDDPCWVRPVRTGVFTGQQHGGGLGAGG